jgi:hypothetical protein
LPLWQVEAQAILRWDAQARGIPRTRHGRLARSGDQLHFQFRELSFGPGTQR